MTVTEKGPRTEASVSLEALINANSDLSVTRTCTGDVVIVQMLPNEAKRVTFVSVQHRNPSERNISLISIKTYPGNGMKSQPPGFTQIESSKEQPLAKSTLTTNEEGLDKQGLFRKTIAGLEILAALQEINPEDRPKYYSRVQDSNFTPDNEVLNTMISSLKGNEPTQP